MSKSESTSSTPETIGLVNEPIRDEPEPSFGWNSYAEIVNGRVAMLAVLSLLALEWFTKQDLFTWLGLR